MTALDLMRSDAPYVARFSDMPNDLQTRAKRLCARYNRTEPDAAEERVAILADLLGTSGPQVFIEPNLRCDYGFNVHFHGLAVVNYDCCFLDTSPIHIGAGAPCRVLRPIDERDRVEPHGLTSEPSN